MPSSATLDELRELVAATTGSMRGDSSSRSGSPGSAEPRRRPRQRTASRRAAPRPAAPAPVAVGRRAVTRRVLRSLAPRSLALDAIVMAAGEGRRLRPITERWPKPVLPIDGRPVIATPPARARRGRVRAGLGGNGHLAEQVEELVTGCEPGLEIHFVRQPEPLGSADAVSRARSPAGALPPCLVSAADTVYSPGDVARLAASAQAAIAWRRSPSGSRPGARGRTGAGECRARASISPRPCGC